MSIPHVRREMKEPYFMDEKYAVMIDLDGDLEYVRGKYHGANGWGMTDPILTYDTYEEAVHAGSKWNNPIIVKVKV